MAKMVKVVWDTSVSWRISFEINNNIKYNSVNIFFLQIATQERSAMVKNVTYESANHEFESRWGIYDFYPSKFLKNISFGQMLWNLKILKR